MSFLFVHTDFPVASRNSMFNLYADRVNERFAYARTLLKKGFDFQKDESYQVSREKEDWAQTEAEIHVFIGILRRRGRRRDDRSFSAFSATGHDEPESHE